MPAGSPGSEQPERVPLTLYLRHGCHLCEDMQRDLLQFATEWGFRVCEVDIDADPALRARYNDLVPVLVCEGQEVCRYYLDSNALKRAIDAAAKPL